MNIAIDSWQENERRINYLCGAYISLYTLIRDNAVFQHSSSLKARNKNRLENFSFLLLLRVIVISSCWSENVIK